MRAAQGVQNPGKARMSFMSFLLYVVGFVVFIAGMGWLATLLGAPQAWIAAGALVLLVIGVFTAISQARMRGQS